MFLYFNSISLKNTVLFCSHIAPLFDYICRKFENMISVLASQTSLNPDKISRTIKLLQEGATIPFLARYRKEITGGMNEVELSSLRDKWLQLTELIKRKEFILATIDSQGLLTYDLKSEIEACYEPNLLEDIYLPFKPKRNTKSEKAKQMGLEPLAAQIMSQKLHDLEYFAGKFVGSEKAASMEDAIEGAGYIIAEWINENISLRNRLRNLFNRKAEIKAVKVKTAVDEKETYKLYFDFTEPVFKASSHRILAIFRGENEGILKVSVMPEADQAIELMESYIIKSYSTTEELLKTFIKDAWKRLLSPSLENEIRGELKKKADLKAIDVFGKNLDQLLMQPPLPGKRILAIDPGFRTGCKVVCLDENGNLLHNETIYPHPPQRETGLATKKINTLVQQFNIDAIAIGNGTAGRETERFISHIRFNRDVIAIMVNESGASVYSASDIARKEFPQFDITVRGAVSIGRRLADPLAELVKIDPKAIGVGQYQHDVDQKALRNCLTDVVISCVNRVGVDINSASVELLQYVSGLGPALANAIVDYRTENGNFISRKQLLDVPKLGAKAFEQSAGFIRIRNAENPLDNTAVHPESYKIVAKMAKDLQVEVKDLIRNKDSLSSINPTNYISTDFGIETIKDIIEELAKPNRDPRKVIRPLEFDKSINSINDLKTGTIYPGVVTNITAFGAFVDLGVHQDGLIHISNMAEEFVSDPHSVLKINQFVEVEVLQVEPSKKRINLKLVKKM